MNLDRKIAFIIKTFELEAPKYIKSDFDYDNEIEFWLDRFLSNSDNFNNLIRNYFDSAYSAALKIANKL